MLLTFELYVIHLDTLNFLPLEINFSFKVCILLAFPSISILLRGNSAVIGKRTWL